MWRVLRAPTCTGIVGLLIMAAAVGVFGWVTKASDTEMPGSVFVFIPPFVGGIALLTAGVIWFVIALVGRKRVRKPD